jgi:hypothetical protein
MNPLLEAATRILILIVPMISDELRNLIKDVITSLEEKAKTTPNTWDDVLVVLLKGILAVR